ncbi:MAG: FMN-binding protein [Thiotrichales bacterium SG8_50]|nr:MAG: FMN-binding protein [Thiotrichales bacterium SG8_50]
MIRALGVIAMLSGVLVVLVYQITQPMIAENKRLAIERAVFRVVPGAVDRRDFVVTETGLEPGQQATGIQIYAGYDGDGALKGIAAEAAARGYQDVIRILYGYNPGCECITGISILQSTETPGLGDKIGTDPAFLANFDALDARLNDTRSALRNAIVTVKHGTKTQRWQIDAISGATISSKAIGKMLDDSTRTLLPRLAPHISQLKVTEP